MLNVKFTNCKLKLNNFGNCMNRALTLLIFSQTSEFRQIYDSAAAIGGFRTVFREKKMSLSTGLFNEKYDAVIIEILRPAVSEVQFVDFIYNTLKNIPIIIISPYFQDTRNILFGNKVADYLSNPITSERLLESIKKNVYETGSSIDLNLEYLTDPVETTKKLSVLLEISRLINSKMELDDVLKTIMNIIQEAFSVERTAVFLDEKDSNDSSTTEKLIKQNIESKLPLHKNIAGTVLKTGLSQIINNPASHPNFSKNKNEKQNFETRNILTVPIKNKNGEVIGVFEVVNKNNGTFTLADEMFLSSIASSAGIAVENAILHRKIKEQLNLARRYSHDLFDSQNKLVREAKEEVVNIFSGFIKNEIQNSKLTGIVEKMKSSDSKKQMKDFANEISDQYENMLNRIEDFTANVKRSIKKEI